MSRLPIVSNADSQPSRFRKLAIRAIVVLLVIAFVLVWMNHDRRSAWDRYKSEKEAQGESLDWRSVHPPALPPDDQNFASARLVKALGVWGQTDPTVNANVRALPIYNELGHIGDLEKYERTDLAAIQTKLRAQTTPFFQWPPLPQDPAADVLLAFTPMESEFNELRLAALRPHAQIELKFPDPVSAQRPNFVALRELAQMYCVKAIAELRLGKADDALADNRVIFRLADASRSSPSVVCVMMYVAINGLVTQPFWEGWLANQWSDEQLIEFQNLFSKVDMLSGYDSGLQGERARINYCMEVLVPTNGWRGYVGVGPFSSRVVGFAFHVCGFEQSSRLKCNQFLDQFVLPNYELREQRIYPAKMAENSARLERAISRWRPSTYLAGIAIPNFTRALFSVAHNQTYVNLAFVVCALERYRRAHGQYPESLDSLTPAFAQRLPRDLFIGQPLKYRRTGDGKFLLYSVGWNAIDDGGLPAKEGKDWVWPVRAKK
ncbi:MAG TPA: hypothetical protein VLU94_00720 [Candidatus Nitrosotalea sp.]|nr:hypothetical protein [Candidatus Nitrosotalea sp.]